jgi:FtsP/CotA-like multicopper oxidase with cupredoxin domain
MIEIPNDGTWTYWIIQEPIDGPVQIPHPIHLHGHDFWILGRGLGTFNYANNFTSLNFNNPPRRDVTFLPAGGWVVLAFPADNPGAWLMHCHIASHISAGLGVQFLESKNQIKGLATAAWDKTCQNWQAYYKTVNVLYTQDDSGL